MNDEPLSKFSAIVLAAGSSTRLPGQNKLLKEINGAPMITRTVKTLDQLGLLEVLVVTGHDDQPMRQALADFTLRFIENIDASDGMGSSIAAGVKKLDDRAKGFFIVLADMPFIQKEDIQALATKFNSAEIKHPICVPTHNEKKGHPVLFHSHYKSALVALTGDKGAKRILEREKNSVITVQRNNAGILQDFDTEGDFQEIEKD